MESERPQKRTNKSRQKSRNPYLKNAWVRKDRDGHIYLFIRSKSGQQAMLNLTTLNPTIAEQTNIGINPERQDSLPRKVLEDWISEQDDSTNVKIDRQTEAVNTDDEFPELIEG